MVQGRTEGGKRGRRGAFSWWRGYGETSDGGVKGMREVKAEEPEGGSAKSEVSQEPRG